MKKGFFLPFLSLILVLFGRQLAFSDMANKYISFQGRIVDANSQPLADGNYSIVFKLYDDPTAGSELWTETQPTVSVTNGLFSVLLGSVSALDPDDFNQNCWLTFSVNGGPYYSPRQRIGVSAYALNVPDLRITTAKIAPGTAGQILMSNGTPATTWTSMSGDATINSSGVVAIAADAVALGTDTTGNYAGSNAEGGSATNAFACSADGTCEIQTGIQSISNNSITIDALNTGAASTITLTNSNATYAANVNVADGALQIGGTSVIDASRNVANVVNLTNTGNTSIGDAGTDTLTAYPNTMNLTGNVGKTIDVGSGALDTTLTVTNSGAGTANLSVEGSVTATSFSGSASNALACSGDATCEANAITVTNDISVSSGSVTVTTGNLAVSTGNVTIAGTITTGVAATEIYQMNQAVRTTDAVTFLTVDTGQGANELYDMDQNVMTSSNVSFVNVTATGNTQIGNATGDLLNVFPAIFDWNDVDENKTIYVGSGVTDRTLTLTNPDATGKANLTVEGTVTAFAFTGSSTNALACSGDATCETQSLSVTNDATVSGGDITGAGSVVVDIGEANVEGITITDGDANSYADIYCADSGGNDLCEFKTGIYNNGGTFYSQNQIYARGGIANDTASTQLSLNDAEGVLFGGPLSTSGNMTLDAVNAAAASTITLQNSNATYVANVTIEGDLTVSGGDITGTASNALACSGDAACEVQSIQRSGNLTIDALNAAATSTITLTNSNATYAANLQVDSVINPSGDNLQFMTNRTDDTTYEWVGWYSGGTRAGIFLWDGAWNNCDGSKFCIFGDGHQLMLKSLTGYVWVDDSLSVNGPIYYGGAASTDPYIKAVAYVSGTTTCPTGFKAIACYGADGETSETIWWAAGSPSQGNVFMPSECNRTTANGTMICAYTP